MMQGEIIAEQVYFPQGSNQFAIGQTSREMIGLNIFPVCNLFNQRLTTNRFVGFDDDPLTPEEIADLTVSYQEIVDGKGIEKPKGMSVRNFLDSL